MAEADALLTEYKRRDFLRILGTGALLALPVPGADRPPRIRLAEGGIYEAFTGKIEMGQGARTLLTQAVAEELGVPVERVRLILGDTALTPDDGGTWAIDFQAGELAEREDDVAAEEDERGGEDSGVTEKLRADGGHPLTPSTGQS